jgi:hypothetical protein
MMGLVPRAAYHNYRRCKMYPDPYDHDPHAGARVDREENHGIREAPMGRADSGFKDSLEKSYEAIRSELGDLRASIVEARQKLIGPVPMKEQPRRDDPSGPASDTGLFSKIEYANSRIYSDVTDLAGLMRDLINRI